MPRPGKGKGKAKALAEKVKVGQCESITVLQGKPRADEAMALLKKIATLVAPIMRKHNWTLPLLCEFFPDNANLLGMNYGGGLKIFIRLRPTAAPDTFYDLEQSLMGTMLHELTHNVHGPHDDKFYAFLDKLQDEYTALRGSGYSGEGFLGDGKRVGHGVSISDANVPLHVAREKALASAAKRAQLEGIMGVSGGRKLGGAAVNRHRHPREILAAAAERRQRDAKSCRSGETVDVEAESKKAEDAAGAIDISDDDEDDPAPVASTSKLEDSDSDIEIVSAPPPKKPAPRVTPAKRPPSVTPLSPPRQLARVHALGWSCPACTYDNTNSLALQCEVCGTTRPLADSDGWLCHCCGTKMEHTFWTCSTCSTVKTSSSVSADALLSKSSAALH